MLTEGTGQATALLLCGLTYGLGIAGVIAGCLRTDVPVPVVDTATT